MQKIHKLILATLSACLLSACAVPSQQNDPALKSEEIIVLSNGPACNQTPAILRTSTKETHVCYFPADGGAAVQFDTPEKRLQHFKSQFGGQCARIDVLSDAVMFSKPRPTTPLHRVGFTCVN